MILCKRLSHTEEALRAVKWIMGKLELTLHNEKTRLVDMYFSKVVLIFLASIIDFSVLEIKTGSCFGRYNRYRLRRL